MVFWSKRWHQKDILKLTDLYHSSLFLTSICHVLFACFCCTNLIFFVFPHYFFNQSLWCCSFVPSDDFLQNQINLLVEIWSEKAAFTRHFRYSSDFLRSSQKFEEISKMVLSLHSKYQSNWELLSNFCGLHNNKYLLNPASPPYFKIVN